MFPARRTDPAHDLALTAALDRLTGGAADRADNPDGWITTIRRLPSLEARYAPFGGDLDPRLCDVLRQRGVEGLKQKRGPAPKAKPSAREIELERKTKKLEKQLAKAQLIIDFQKKAHEILGIPLKNHGLDEDD